MSNVSEAHELLSSAIFLMAKELKANTNMSGQWYDSLSIAILEAKKAREHLEGMQ